MRTSPYQSERASARLFRVLLALTVAALPALHGHFHGIAPSDSGATTQHVLTAASSASQDAHDSDHCPICCLIRGGSSLPKAMVQLVDAPSAERLTLVERPVPLSRIVLASCPPRAPPV